MADPNILRMRYRFDVLTDLPALGLQRGDSVTYDPACPAEPYLLHRPIAPDVGALLAALEDGTLAGVIPPQIVPAARSGARPALRLLPSDAKATG